MKVFFYILIISFISQPIAIAGCNVCDEGKCPT